MSRDPDDRPTLERSLARAIHAFEALDAPAVKRSRRSGEILGPVGLGLGIGSVALVGLGVVTSSALFAPAAILGAGAGAVLAVRYALSWGPLRTRDPHHPHIGMGATVAASARVEPGAVVEMGATVGERSVIRAGAVVRMGADIGDDVVLEPGVVVGWGASVADGVVVHEGASLGAGASVERGAQVSAGLHVSAGSTLQAQPTDGRKKVDAPAAEIDTRAARIDALCTRLESELRGSPEGLRAFLGSPEKTVAALRRTCLDLHARERGLRAEAADDRRSRLVDERAQVAARAAASTDELVRRSLTGAVTAIDEQLHQRDLLERNADRLDAELTRLLYTLEGLLSQVLRLRSEGGTHADAALENTVARLRGELDAIAEAVESVNEEERAGLRLVAEAPADLRELDPQARPARRRDRT